MGDILTIFGILENSGSDKGGIDSSRIRGRVEKVSPT